MDNVTLLLVRKAAAAIAKMLLISCIILPDSPKAQVGPFIHNVTGQEGLAEGRLMSASDLMGTKWTDLWALWGQTQEGVFHKRARQWRNVMEK